MNSAAHQNDFGNEKPRPLSGDYSPDQLRIEPPRAGTQEAPPPQSLTGGPRRFRLFDAVCGALLCFLGIASVVLTYPGLGYTWDEELYRRPGIATMTWWSDLFGGDTAMLAPAQISAHWGSVLDSQDPLHPEIAPLPRLLLGAGDFFFSRFTNNPLVAMRIPFAVIFGLTLSLLYCWGTRDFGRWTGAAAALFYLLLPRAFGHAHIAASETVTAFFAVGTAYYFTRSCDRAWLLTMVAVFFGCAIATKVTLWILPAILILWGHVFRRRSYGNGVIALLYLAPLVALAMWPWLWHDTIRRLASYVMFYLEHQKTAVFYLGQKWGYTYGPPAPWHYPWTVLAAGTPEWFLLFAILGMAAVFAKSFRSGSALLITVLALVWPAISSMPSSPKYDGERLFFPTFVFLALLGGIGFQRLLETITRNSVPSSRRKGIGLALLSVVCLWAGMDLALSHPNELNYFNFAVGRPQGALRKGFETSYWGESLNEDACAYLSRRIQPGDKTLVLAMNPQCFVDLQRWGKLPAGAEFTSGELPVDWIVMQIRQGFMGQLETNLFWSGRAVQVFTAQGVPRLALFDGSLLHRDGETTVAQSAVPPAPSADSARTSQTVTTSTVARQGSETTATTASQSQP